VSYVPIEGRYIEGEGNFVYYLNVPFPSKCVATVEAINAINPIKRSLINTIRLFASSEFRIPLFSLALVGKNARARLITRICQSINEEADVSAAGFYLEDGYYCKIVKEIRNFIFTLLKELGVEENIATKTSEVIGMLFEYDNAYRFRLLDILTEANRFNFLYSFSEEIDRLLKLSLERDPNPKGMDFKFNSIAKLFKYLWIIPAFKKNLQKAIESINFDNCRMDEADIYHTCLYGSYNTGGKTLEERIKILEGYHGSDQTKWPPRIVTKSM
jgi:hypothetical protein